MRLGFLVLICLSPQEDYSARVERAAAEIERADPREVTRVLERLAALGDGALPHLDARAKKSAGRTRDYLEMAAQEIRAARLVPDAPPVRRITMKATNRIASDVLSDFRGRTKLDFSLDNLMEEERPTEVSVDLKDVPLMEAFDAICKAGNISLMMEGSAIMLYPRAYIDMPRFFHGHHVIQLQSFVSQKTVNFRKPAQEMIILGMAHLWDPAGEPARWSPARVLEARDDRGANLVPPAPKKEARPAAPGPESVLQLLLEGEMVQEASDSLELLPLSPGAQKIALLRGYVPVAIARSKVAFSIETPEAEMKRETGGFTLTVASIDPDQYHVSVEIASKKKSLEELRKMPPVTVVAVLKGGERARTLVTMEDAGEGRTALTANISIQMPHLQGQGGVPAPGEAKPMSLEKLEITLVTDVLERRIPFEFRDLKVK